MEAVEKTLTQKTREAVRESIGQVPDTITIEGAADFLTGQVTRFIDEALTPDLTALREKFPDVDIPTLKEWGLVCYSNITRIGISQMQREIKLNYVKYKSHGEQPKLYGTIPISFEKAADMVELDITEDDCYALSSFASKLSGNSSYFAGVPTFLEHLFVKITAEGTGFEVNTEKVQGAFAYTLTDEQKALYLMLSEMLPMYKALYEKGGMLYKTEPARVAGIRPVRSMYNTVCRAVRPSSIDITGDDYTMPIVRGEDTRDMCFELDIAYIGGYGKLS